MGNDDDAVGRLASLLGNLRTHSKLALHQAAQARQTPGVGATLIIQINPDPAKPSEVYYSTVPSKLVAEPWRSYQNNVR